MSVTLHSSKTHFIRLVSVRLCSTEKQRRIIEYLSVLDQQTDGGIQVEAPPVSMKFVPTCGPARQEDIEKLEEFVLKSKRLLVMTGTCNYHNVKFLNFRTPENFAVICLKFKQRGQTLGYFVKKIEME